MNLLFIPYTVIDSMVGNGAIVISSHAWLFFCKEKILNQFKCIRKSSFIDTGAKKTEQIHTSQSGWRYQKIELHIFLSAQHTQESVPKNLYL